MRAQTQGPELDGRGPFVGTWSTDASHPAIPDAIAIIGVELSRDGSTWQDDLAITCRRAR